MRSSVVVERVHPVATPPASRTTSLALVCGRRRSGCVRGHASTSMHALRTHGTGRRLSPCPRGSSLRDGELVAGDPSLVAAARSPLAGRRSGADSSSRIAPLSVAKRCHGAADRRVSDEEFQSRLRRDQAVGRGHSTERPKTVVGVHSVHCSRGRSRVCLARLRGAGIQDRCPACRRSGARCGSDSRCEGQATRRRGALDNDEARAVAAYATRQVRSPDLLGRLLRGETLTSSLSEREVRIGIAANCVFFVVVFPLDPSAMSLVAVDELRSDIEEMVRDARSGISTPLPSPPTSTGGSSSGPAELPVVEVGVTVRRRNPN